MAVAEDLAADAAEDLTAEVATPVQDFSVDAQGEPIDFLTYGAGAFPIRFDRDSQGTAAAAVLDGRVVGFGLCGPARVEPACDGTEAEAVPAPVGEVYAFYLHPDAWGSGCAPALMAACEDWLRGQSFTTAVLWVLRDNPRGRAFYEKAGWQPTGKDGTFDGPATAASLPYAIAEVEYGRSLR